MAHPSDAHLIEALVAARDAGDNDALNAAAWALVDHHRGWVVTLYNRYMRRTTWPAAARDDYMQELLVRAHAAVRRYDPAGGAAVPRWIKIHCHHASHVITDQVHPLGLRTGAHAHARSTGRGITGLTTVALDAPATGHDEVGDTNGDLLADDDDHVVALEDRLTVGAQAAMVRELLERCGLSELQLEVITRYLGLDGAEPESERELGRRLGMTRAGVNYSYLRGIARLQHPTALRQIVRARI